MWRKVFKKLVILLVFWFLFLRYQAGDILKKNKNPEKIIFCGGFLHHWSYHIHLVHGSKISVPKNSLLRYYHDWSRRFELVHPFFPTNFSAICFTIPLGPWKNPPPFPQLSQEASWRHSLHSPVQQPIEPVRWRRDRINNILRCWKFHQPKVIQNWFSLCQTRDLANVFVENSFVAPVDLLNKWNLLLGSRVFLQLKNCCWQLGSVDSSFTGETQIHNAKGKSGYWRVFDFAHQRIPKSRFTVCGALFYGTKVKPTYLPTTRAV